ncbi:hypothetical protein ACJMK2_029076 [Sinanodonta woodiana]|uniref:Amine oxidase n=1 Tax=Sinanodonta woodiana TaxID=1069815 RepID=A0ABD3X926_SINWO
MAGYIFLIMLCWSLMSVSTQQSQATWRYPTSAQKPRILILGAGMAGITAAKALHDKGYDNFIILEGSNRVGGRIKEVMIGGITVEAGAGWIHPDPQNLIQSLADRVNLSYVPLDSDDHVVRDGNGNDVTLEFDTRYNTSFDPAFKFLNSYAKEANAKGKPDFTVRSALSMGGWQPKSHVDDVIEVFNIDGDYPYPPEVNSGLNAFFGAYSGAKGFSTTEDLTVIDKRGFSQMVRGLRAEFLPDGDQRLRMNEVVTDIENKDGGISVRTRDNVTYSADYVIVTFSIGVLQHDEVRFSPTLPLWKREAINQFQQGHLMHIYLKFAETFWDDNEFILYASERRNYYNMWQNVDKNFPGSNILQVLVLGDEVIRLERMDDRAILNEVISTLSTMYRGRSISPVIAYSIPRWNSDPLFRGAFSNWPSGYTLDTFNGLIAPVGKIYFAGDYGDPFHYGTIQASYISALRVVDNIDKCVRGLDSCEAPYQPKYEARGCTYHGAQNYNARAKEDDGSCIILKCPISSSGSVYYENYTYTILLLIALSIMF